MRRAGPGECGKARVTRHPLHASTTRHREQERAAAEIAGDTAELLRRFAAQLSVSDAAVLLGVSKGRISQLRSGSARQT